MDSQPIPVPRHIGFIIDGNRRWAKAQGLQPYDGHFAGYNVMKEILIDVLHRGVKYASCYVFSTENWTRPKAEVNRLMKLLTRVLRDDLHYFNEENVRLRIIGGRDQLDASVVASIEAAEKATAHNDGGDLLLCINYGGHQEIADAVKKVVQLGVKPEDITPDLISQHLYAPDIPPCDMIVRTSGEHRLSNFMLWRASYSELLFLNKNWPEMTKKDVAAILREYEKRNRRFGG